MIANFSLFFAFYVLTPLLPLYLSETFGATKDVIGLVLSGYTINRAALLGCLICIIVPYLRKGTRVPFSLTSAPRNFYAAR